MAKADKITKVDVGLRRGEGWVERRERDDGSVVFASRWYDGSGADRKLQYHPHPHPEGADEQDTADQAGDYNRAVARQKRRGHYAPPTKRTVDEQIVSYLERGKLKWSSSTYYTHQRRHETLISPYLGTKIMASLTTDDVQRWIDTLTATYNARTVYGAVAVLSGAMRAARKAKIITDNPLENVEMPPLKDIQHATWSEEEVAKVLDAVAYHPRYSALYNLAIVTGARPGELLYLRWRNVDLDGGWVRIATTRTKSETGQTVEGSTTKTKTERRIPIDQATQAALRRLASDSDSTGEDFVFKGRSGPIALETWRVYHGNVIDALGVTRITLHEIRHTSASLEVAAGTNWLIVKSRLGHKSIQTTLDIYSHLSPVQYREAAEAFGQRFRRDQDTTTTPENGAK